MASSMTVCGMLNQVSPLVVSCVMHCSLVNSFLHENPYTVVEQVKVSAILNVKISKFVDE